MLTISHQEDRSRISLSGEITIYQAQTFAEALFPLLSLPQHLEMDLSEVTQIDGSGVQILMVSKRHRAQAGRGLSLINHSQALVSVFEKMGLISWFSDPLILPSENPGSCG